MIFFERKNRKEKRVMFGIKFIKVQPETPLQIESEMAENGAIFSEEIEKDFWSSIPERMQRFVPGMLIFHK